MRSFLLAFWLLVIVFLGAVGVLFMTGYFPLQKPKALTYAFPSFVTPPGWHRVDSTNLIVDKKGDTLLINHYIRHTYTFSVK